jgi:RNA-binding protein
MEITKAQRNYLRRLANPLKPTVQIGKQGLTEQIIEKINRELDAHELIKVRLLEFKDQKQQLAQTIVDETGAALVIVIGNVIALFRPSPDPDRQIIVLPGADAKEDEP